MASADTSEPLRIMIVEDEALLAMQMEGALADGGHEVVGTVDSRDGAMALAAEARPDLVLVDIQLHGKRVGIDIAGDMMREGIPCLLATGNCPEGKGRGVALGCLHKPFDDRTLRAAVVVAETLLEGGKPAHLPPGMHLY